MRKMQAALVWLGICIALVHADTFSTRISSSLQSLFTFTEGLSDTSAQFSTDKVGAAPFGRLKTNVPPSSWDQTRVGLSYPLTSTTNLHRALTEQNNTALLSGWNSTGAFTIEMWIETPYYELNSKPMDAMVAGFGDIPVNAPYIADCSDASYNLRSMGGMRLLQTGVNLVLEYITSISGSISCARLQSSIYLGPTHLAIVYDKTQLETLKFYVNNVQRSSAGGLNSPTIPFWFNTNGQGYPFYISPKWTSPSDVMTNFWVGSTYLLAFYGSPLSAANVTTNYNAWLPNSPPSGVSASVSVGQNILTYFVLNCTDFDVTSGRASATSLRVSVQTLPTVGQLYYLNSSTSQLVLINSTSLLINDSSRTLAYAPATNVLGSFPFQFKCFDGTSESRTSAQATMSVFHVNQPPTAVNSSQSGYSGGYSFLTLTGTDVDGNAEVTAAYVLSLPLNGTLYQTNSSNGLGAAITSVPIKVLDSQRRVIFYSPFFPANFSGSDVFLNTTFSFIVADTFGLNSTNVAYQTVEIRNNLQPTSFPVGILQDSNTTVQMQYLDRAGTGQPVDYVIVTGPSGGGVIKSPNGTITYSTFPAVIPGGQFFYVAPPNKYGVGYESLTYLVQFAANTSNPGFASPLATITFDLGIVYHAPKLSLLFPIVTPFQTTTNVDYSFSVSLSSNDPETTVVVSIETTGFGCTVAVPNSTITSQLKWRIGDGRASPMLTFEASRALSAAALKQLKANSVVSGTRAIQITAVERSTLSASIQIDVTTTDDASTSGSTGSAAFAGTYIVVGWAVIGGLCCCCCCCYCMRRYHDFVEAKHKKQHEHEHTHDENVTPMNEHLCVHCAVQRWKRKAAMQIEIRTGSAPEWAPDPEQG